MLGGGACVLVWGSWGIKWRKRVRRGDEGTCWEGSLYALLLLPAIPLPPSLASFHPPPPSLPVRGGKVHYMLANQTSITSLEGMKQETRVSFFSPLSAHFIVSPPHLPPAPPSSPKLPLLLSRKCFSNRTCWRYTSDREAGNARIIAKTRMALSRVYTSAEALKCPV